MHHIGKETYKRIIQMNRKNRVIKLRRGTYIVLHIEYPYFFCHQAHVQSQDVFSLYIANKASLKSF
jgi:hypothetical protein